ncbi:MAG: adenylate kinase [Candidatus Aminicenantes bacterium]|nr:adenylate kinase [Candidatus Aminicenantes bacterium]
MRVILLGPPGSGKGTQACLIEEKFRLPRISTGDILREAVRRETPLGRRAEDMMKRGLLVSDDIVVGLVEEAVQREEHRHGYVLDGFPRTVAQAESLLRIDGRRPERVLDIQVGAEDLVDRLSRRHVCPGCRAVFGPASPPGAEEGRCAACGGALEIRADDKPEVIRERLRVFEAQTAPLREYYRSRSVYRTVPGTGRPEEVFGRIVGQLEAFLSGATEERRS